MNYDLSQGGLVTNNSSLITMNPLCINRPGRAREAAAPFLCLKSTQRAESKSQTVGNDCDDNSDPSHFQAGRPPRPDRNQ